MPFVLSVYEALRLVPVCPSKPVCKPVCKPVFAGMHARAVHTVGRA